MSVEGSRRRARRSLDIVREHALKALQTIERTIAETNEVLRGLSDEAIRVDEARLSARLKRTVEAAARRDASPTLRWRLYGGSTNLVPASSCRTSESLKSATV